MRTTSFAALLAAAALTACSEQTPLPRVAPEPAASQPAATAPASSQPAGTGATTSSTTPATSEERKDGANPVQGQVDPKEREQRRGFQHPNEKAGPTSPETQPKTGG